MIPTKKTETTSYPSLEESLERVQTKYPASWAAYLLGRRPSDSEIRDYEVNSMFCIPTGGLVSEITGRRAPFLGRSGIQVCTIRCDAFSTENDYSVDASEELVVILPEERRV